MPPLVPRANAIKLLRSAKGWTQRQLATKIGVTRERLERIENAKCMPRLDEAQHIAQALDLPLDEIFPT